MSEPRVAIGLPVYNGETHIEQAIESILGQTFEDLQLIISDNASDDRTEQICLAYASRDSRVRYFRNSENIGSTGNFNRAFSYADSEYFKWAAADDFIDREFIRRCIEILDADSSVVLATSAVQLVDADGAPLPFDQGFREWIRAAGGTYNPPSEPPRLDSDSPWRRFTDVVLLKQYFHETYGVIRSSALRSTSLHQPFVGSDKALVAELSLLGRIRSIDEPLFNSRIYLGRPTHYRSPALARATDPGWDEPRIYVPEFRLAREYWRIAGMCPGGMKARLFCRTAVARKILQPDKLAKLLVPGRSNYLGLGTKRNDPTELSSD